MTCKLLKRLHAGKVTEPYRIMEELIDKHHAHLTDVKIAIAWRFGWGANADGLMTMGRTKKCGDLDRELAAYDFVILLNHEAWNRGGLNTAHQTALIDHELCHAEVTMDTNGEPKRDEEGRLVCRIRRHDIEEFRDVVARHGCYTSDLDDFVRKSIADAARPLLNAPANGNGETVPDTIEGELLPVHEPKSRKRRRAS